MRLHKQSWFAVPFTAGLFAFGLLACNGPAPSSKDTSVELKQVTYAELDAKVKEQKGKVVVIDVWFRA